MKKKILIIIIIYVLGVLTPIIWGNVIKDVLESKVIYTIKIKRAFINLRPEVNLSSDIIRQVYKDEEFKVIKYFEGNTYNWYQVIYEEGKTGWVADTKDNEWIIVENDCK